MSEETKAPLTPVALSHTKHKGVRIRKAGSTKHIEKSHYALIFTGEFSKVGLDSPIIFLKDPKGDFMAASMWGLEPGENLFVDNGEWTGGFYPAFPRCYPFAMQKDPEKEDHFYIGLFEDPEYVNTEEGELIMDENGEETEWMKNLKEFLVQIYQQENTSRQFAKRLDDLGLLIERTLSITSPDGQKKDVGGFWVVNRDKLMELPDEEFLALRKDGGLDVIYSHLMSLASVDKLAARKFKRQMQAKQEEATAS